MLRTAQRGQQLLTLTLVKTEDRVNIGAAVAVFGEETGDRFCRVVGADDNAFGHPGDAVLRFHALAGFLVAANKIAQLNARFAKRLLACQHRALNINGQHAVRLNEGNGILAILLVRLYAIRKTHRDKLQFLIARLFAKL